MPKIFPIVIKKTIAQAITGANFVGLQNVGVKLSTLLTSLAPANVGVKMNSVLTALVPESVGIATSQLVSGTSLASLSEAEQLTSLYNNTSLGADVPAAKIVQIQYDLTHTAGGTSQTSAGSWTNGANALGKHDGTNATNANTLTVAASGALVLSYASQANRTPLTISSVNLMFYGSYSPGLTSPCTYTIDYSLDGGTNWTTYISRTTAATFSGTALDITAAVAGDWTKLTNLKVRHTLTGVASATPSTASVDAVELVVVASSTQVP